MGTSAEINAAGNYPRHAEGRPPYPEGKPPCPEGRSVILFDGVCNLCNAAVQFIIKHEKGNDFLFASLQSDVSSAILQKHRLDPKAINSFVFVTQDRVYLKSTAALKVAKHLKTPWNWWYGFIVVPKFIRDFFYDMVARTRYRIFGKRSECMMPSPELKSKFL